MLNFGGGAFEIGDVLTIRGVCKEGRLDEEYLHPGWPAQTWRVRDVNPNGARLEPLESGGKLDTAADALGEYWIRQDGFFFPEGWAHA